MALGVPHLVPRLVLAVILGLGKMHGFKPIASSFGIHTVDQAVTVQQE